MRQLDVGAALEDDAPRRPQKMPRFCSPTTDINYLGHGDALALQCASEGGAAAAAGECGVTFAFPAVYSSVYRFAAAVAAAVTAVADVAADTGLRLLSLLRGCCARRGVPKRWKNYAASGFPLGENESRTCKMLVLTRIGSLVTAPL